MTNEHNHFKISRICFLPSLSRLIYYNRELSSNISHAEHPIRQWNSFHKICGFKFIVSCLETKHQIKINLAMIAATPTQPWSIALTITLQCVKLTAKSITHAKHLVMTCQWAVDDLFNFTHYSDVIMGSMASQITSITIVYSAVYSGADIKKTSKLRVTGLCAGYPPGPLTSPHK